MNKPVITFFSRASSFLPPGFLPRPGSLVFQVPGPVSPVSAMHTGVSLVRGMLLTSEPRAPHCPSSCLSWGGFPQAVPSTLGRHGSGLALEPRPHLPGSVSAELDLPCLQGFRPILYPAVGKHLKFLLKQRGPDPVARCDCQGASSVIPGSQKKNVFSPP